MARLIDNNGIIDVIDDNGVNCFVDEVGNTTCADAGGGGIYRYIVFNSCLAALAVLPLL